MEVYIAKVTLADYEAAAAREGSAQDKNVALLINKAQDADGNPLFASGDSHFLKVEAEGAVVQRLINALYETLGAAASTEEAAAQIRANPTSGSTSTSPET
jgi:hypothetical protein